MTLWCICHSSQLCVPLQRAHSAPRSSLLFMKVFSRTGPSINLSGTLLATGLQIQLIHGEQKSISRQPAPLHQGHVLPDQHRVERSCFLWWINSIREQGKGYMCSDTVSHNILFSKLRREDFDGRTIRYVRNFLYGCIWSAVVNSSMFKQRSVTSAVP